MSSTDPAADGPATPDPRWVSGPGVQFVSLDKRTVRYRVEDNGTITVAPDHANTRIDLEVNAVSVQRLVLNGQDLPANVSLYIEAHGLKSQLVIHSQASVQLDSFSAAAVPDEDSRTAPTPTRVEVRIDANKITVPSASNVSVAGPGNTQGACERLTLTGDVSTKLDGSMAAKEVVAERVSELTLNRGLSDCVVDAPVAHVTVSQLVQDVDVRVRQMTAPKGAVGLTGHVGGRLDVQSLERATLRCGSLKSDGSLSQSHVHAVIVEVTHGSTDSSVYADELVVLGGAVARCVVKAGTGIVVNGRHRGDAPEPYTVGHDAATAAGFDRSSSSATTDSTLVVSGDGAVLAGQLNNCDVRTNGDVWVDGQVTLNNDDVVTRGQPARSGRHRIHANALACGDVTAALDALDVRHLHSNRSSQLSGNTEDRVVSVVVRREATAADETSLSCRHVALLGTIDGRFVVRANENTLGQFGEVQSLESTGSTTITTDSRELIAHAGDEGSTTIGFDGHLNSLTVESGCSAHVTPKDRSTIASLAVAGAAEVVAAKTKVVATIQQDQLDVEVPLPKAPQRDRKNSATTLARLTVHPDASLSLLHRDHPERRLTLSLRMLDLGDSEPPLWKRWWTPTATIPPVATSEDRPHVTLTASTQWQAAVDVGYATTAPAGPTIRLVGPTEAELVGGYRHLEATRRRGATPVVGMPQDSGRVSSAAGDIILSMPHAGRLDGHPRRIAEVGRFQPDKTNDLVVHGIKSLPPQRNQQEAEPPRQGALRDVDLTHVEYENLDELRHLHILDPTPASLREFASDRTIAANGEGERYRQAMIRDRSEWMSLLADITRDRAISGASRTSARWAEARLRHRANPRPSVEAVARWFFARLFGYGVRPGPPTAMLLLAYLTVVAVRVGRWRFLGFEGAQFQWLDAMRDALLLPLSFLRFGDPVQMFHSDFWNAVAFAGLVLPLLAVIVATRAYLRDS